jgi:hypothetical protein
MAPDFAHRATEAGSMYDEYSSMVEYTANTMLRFGGKGNQSNRCHPTSALPSRSLDPSSFSSPEEATRLRRSVTPPRMLDRPPSPRRVRAL